MPRQKRRRKSSVAREKQKAFSNNSLEQKQTGRGHLEPCDYRLQTLMWVRKDLLDVLSRAANKDACSLSMIQPVLKTAVIANVPTIETMPKPNPKT